jgi:hypothetical protein
VLAEEEPRKALGSALALARRHGGAAVHVVVEHDAGLLARRASQLAAPPTIWWLVGDVLERAEPEPLPVQPPLDPRIRPFADRLVAAGCDPVVEHGRLVGEVNGLEVARVAIVDGEPRLEVGVGRFDREANDELAGGEPGDDALQRAVDHVRRFRTDDGVAHPLKLVAASRWLRTRVLADPALVGADHLAPMAPTVEPPDLRTPWPAPATGIDREGAPLVVVCSVGVDLDLVPAAADARLADGRGARLVLAVPERDAHPVTVALAAMLAEPATVVPLSIG